MEREPVRVVADTVVLFQALVNPAGPAGALLGLAHEQVFTLLVSRDLFAEVLRVCTRPDLMQRFGYTPGEVQVFLEELDDLAELVEGVPHVFDYPRDPDDAYLVDLAVAAGATVITSRDNDLLDLMRDTPEAAAFRTRFPRIEILTPPDLLGKLRSEGAGV